MLHPSSGSSDGLPASAIAQPQGELTRGDTFDSPVRWAPDLSAAIEPNPLTVAPDTLLVEVIALISQAHHQCFLPSHVDASSVSLADYDGASLLHNRHAGCVLVMEGQTLQGILTERDMVRLTAAGINFRGVTVAEVMVSPVVTLPQHSIQDIFAALFLLRRYRIRHLPVVAVDGRVIGVISHASLRQVLRPANLLKFRRVADVMSTQVVCAPMAVSVLHLARLMADHRVSCVVLISEDEDGTPRPVGIITERDIVQFQVLQIDLIQTPAQMVMSTPLLLLTPQDSLWMAQQEMQKRHVGRLVVSWNWGQNMGIVTQTSLLRVFDPMEMYGIIENLQQTIQHLKAEKGQSAEFSGAAANSAKDMPTVPQATSHENSKENSTLGLTAPSQPPSDNLTDLLLTLDQLIEQPDLSAQEMRSHLRSVRQSIMALSNDLSREKL